MVSYKCIYCQKIFSHKGNYISHNNYVNKCKEKLEQSILKFKNYTKNKLMDDFRNLNFEEIKYKCEKCGKCYTSYNGLKKHKQKKACEKQLIINQTLNISPDQIVNEIISETKNKLRNKKPIEKYKKRQIPLSLKRVVWDYWIGEDIGRTKCLCCNVTQISQMNFHCGPLCCFIRNAKHFL